MSFLVGALLNTAVQTAVSSAGTILYYGVSGVWWAGKRVIYGRQPTIQEQQALILEQQAQILEKMKALPEE
jgi:uncharacterized membrane protein YfbV (UPF0208 family)